MGVQLANISSTETRRVIVQAGAFGEHTFTDVAAGNEPPVLVNGKYFTVELPPSTSIRVQAGLNRFDNQPSYAFPWHEDGIPVPFD